MKKAVRTTLALGGLLLALLAAQPAAQSLNAELQRAIQQEVVTGDLRAAIGAYEQIVARAGADRAVAAQALMRIAECHEKLGDGEAQKIYERIVRDYATQGDAVTFARARLGRKEGTEQQEGITLRKVWDGGSYGYDISADGRHAVYVGAGGSLRIHDLADGADWELIAGDQCAGPTVISNDGTVVAYEHYCEAYGSALRMVNVQGRGVSPSRLLYEDPDVSQITPMDIAPDKSSVAVVVVRKDRSRQIGLVDTASGSLRVLKTIDWRGPSRMFYSPDGQDLAYDLPASDATAQRDVFVLAVDATREVPAVVHPANDKVLGWSPDGKYLLFASDRRNGAMGLWEQAFRDRTPYGDAHLLVGRLPSELSLGVTRSGALYLSVGAGDQDLAVAPIDLTSGRQTGPATRPIQNFIGTNMEPAWSPDGKFLAYVSWRGNPPDQRVLGIRSIDTGGTRELTPKLSYFDQMSWAPNSEALVTGGTDLKGRNGIFKIDAGTGEPTLIVQLPGDFERSFPQWSVDGKHIYYRRPLNESALNGDVALLERDLVSGEEREVARGNLGAPSLSPDGRWIATQQSDRSAGSQALLLIPVQGGRARELLRAMNLMTDFMAAAAGIPWTPDSSGVLVRRRVTADTMELWLVPIANAPPRKLDIDVSGWATGNRGFISLSPDGRHIAFFLTGNPRSPSVPQRIETWVLENFLDREATR